MSSGSTNAGLNANAGLVTAIMCPPEDDMILTPKGLSIYLLVISLASLVVSVSDSIDPLSIELSC